MLKKLSNPYDVLSETISFENVQQIGEMITLKALRGLSQYPHACYQQLYLSYIQDLNQGQYVRLYGRVFYLENLIKL